jgi:hypothetical protein
MSASLHQALLKAHQLLEDEGDDDAAYEIETAINMFEPRDGDDPETARQRSFMNATCGNCDFTWPGMPMPAPLTEAATTGQRMAKCPRCFETKKVFLTQ